MHLHRLLMNPPIGFEVDHINGNSFDNRRSNLRIVTHSENMQNSIRNLNTLTGERGVYMEKVKYGKGIRYRARIWLNGKRIQVGSSVVLEKAIKLVRAAREKYYIQNRVTA